MSDKRILQTGLFSTDDDEAAQMVKRVTKFNLTHIGTAVKLDVIPHEKGDQWCPVPHYKFRFLFPSREAMAAFWAGS